MKNRLEFMRIKIRKIITIISILLVIGTMSIDKVKTLSIYGESSGINQSLNLPDCHNVNTDPLCGNISSDFEVRVTIVDEYMVKYDGTRTVGLLPKNSDDPNQYCNDDGSCESYNIFYGRNVYDHGGWMASFEGEINGGSEQMWVYGGTSVAYQNYNYDSRAEQYSCGGGNWDSDACAQFEVYLGSNVYGDEDFDNYQYHRERFNDFITDLYAKEIYVDGVGYVTLFDYISDITGFTRVETEKYGSPANWDGYRITTNSNVIRAIAQEYHDYGYRVKILVEPVFNLYIMNYNFSNRTHAYRGTAKQLASLLSRSVYGNLWFWPGYSYESIKNIACSFMDESGMTYDPMPGVCWDDWQLTNKVSRAVDLINRNKYIEKKWPYYCDTACTEARKSYDRATKNAASAGSSISYIQDFYSNVADPSSKYGLNILDVTESISDQPIKEVRQNKCEYNISSCDNNGFTFTSTLNSSTGDIFDCIYPSETNKISGDVLKNYSTHFENGDLWCYDNTTYSFEQLNKSFTDNQPINISPIITNQLLAIPHGTLTVERTCFSKNSNVPIGDLDAAFEADNARYQEEFKLNLNGKEYTYKRGQKYQGTREKTSGFEYKKNENKTNPYGENYVEYTSTFNYDYELTVGEDAMKSNINILNYNISSALGSSNGIDYSKNKNIYAKVINAPTMENKEYTNTLYTNNSTKEARINGGYGYSNNFFDALNDYCGDTKNDSNTLERSGERQEWYDDEYYNFTNTYIMTEKVNKNCNFKTTGTDVNVWDEIQFRTISLSNPFPGRDGTSRIPGTNWLSKTNNFVYDYIQNNRNVTAEEVYNKEPLYTVTLDTQSMIKIREYNKNHNYSDYGLVCESGTGRKCRSNFLRNNEYIKKLEGTCSSLDVDYYSCADKPFTSGG